MTSSFIQNGGHPLKVRRIWTYNQTPNVYQHQNQRTGFDKADARALTYIQTGKEFKQGNILTSLITKLKCVERPQQNSLSSFNFKKLNSLVNNEFQFSQVRNQNCSNLALMQNNKRQNLQIIKNNSQCSYNNQVSGKRSINHEIDDLRQQNKILKQKMYELIIENEKMKKKFKRYFQQLNDRMINICKKQQEIKQKEDVLAQKQQFISLQRMNINLLIKVNEQKLNLVKIQQKGIQKLQINHEFEEIIFPIKNMELSKAFQQIKQLKLDKIDLEKKYMHNLSQYRKKKQQEFQKLKKGFTNKLNYYKELLLKVSIKHTPEIRKYQSDTFQTVILETSSADQS